MRRIHNAKFQLVEIDVSVNQIVYVMLETIILLDDFSQFSIYYESNMNKKHQKVLLPNFVATLILTELLF